MAKHQPRSRVYTKLEPEFASDYIKALRILSRKHQKDDAVEVKQALRLLRIMSRQSLMAHRGELWIPTPDKRTGYYPIIEKIPYDTVRTMLRKNAGETLREKSRERVAASTEPFHPLFARRPGTLNEAQRKRFLEHASVALPFTKGRTPAFLGQRVPGAGPMRSRSIISSRPGELALSPEEWERGFTLKKFGLSEDLSKAIKRRMTAKPKLRIPSSKPPKMDIKKTLANALDTRVKLEPENNYAIPDMRLRDMKKRTKIAGGFAAGLAREKLRRARQMNRHNYAIPEKVTAQRKINTAELGRQRVMAEGAAHKIKLEQIKRRAKTDPNFKFNPKTSQWSWSSPATTTALAKRPITPRPRSRIRTIATKGLARKVALVGTGMAATSAIAHLIKKRKAKYTLTATERQCYEDGFSERWNQLKRDAAQGAHKVINWLRGDILPVVARGAVTGGAEMLQQEIGIRPTTIGLDPVRRAGFDQKLIDYPNQDLRSIMQGLQEKLTREADPILRKGLERSLGLIATELVIRRRLA